MNPHHPSAFDARRSSFEEAYFRSKDADLVAKLQKVFEAKRDREELRAATGITNEEVLDRMVAVHAQGQMLTVFKLFPLVEIAWADGAFDHKEGDAVVAAAVKHGIPMGSPGIERIKEWLNRGPNPEARAAWYMYAGELKKVLSAAELKTFREDLLKMCRQVADTSGGIFGMFFNVSQREQTVINKVAESLTH